MENHFDLAATEAVRFRLARIDDGRWLVLDEGRWRRVVATCHHERDAQAIAALMNGDAERAQVIHAEFLADENPFLFADPHAEGGERAANSLAQ